MFDINWDLLDFEDVIEIMNDVVFCCVFWFIVCEVVVFFVGL